MQIAGTAVFFFSPRKKKFSTRKFSRFCPRKFARAREKILKTAREKKIVCYGIWTLNVCLVLKYQILNKGCPYTIVEGFRGDKHLMHYKPKCITTSYCQRTVFRISCQSSKKLSLFLGIPIIISYDSRHSHDYSPISRK